MQQELRFPRTEEKTERRPERCPRCGGEKLDRHGVLRRRVIDPKLETVEVVRYRCRACHKTMRMLPEGVTSNLSQTRCEAVLSATLYGLGLSYDKASLVLKALGCGLVKSAIWDNVQSFGRQVRRHFQRMRKRVGRRPVLGFDETEIKIKGKGVSVGFVTDPQSGLLVGMRILASRDGEEMGRWLSQMAQDLGCEVVVTDEWESYKGAAATAGTEHQLCLAHWRKAITRRRKKIEGYEKEKELIRTALEQLDGSGLKALRWLHRHFAKAPPPRKGEHQSPAYTMRRLTLDCLENWSRLTCYQKKEKALPDQLGRRVRRDYSVPSTNNATENAIGRAGKIRHKAMRGFKSRKAALPTLFFLACLGNVLAGVSFQDILR